MRLPRLAFPALLALVSAAGPSSATTIRVPHGQPTIQIGIYAASPGDTVLVACGTYYEHDIEMRSGVYLTSETGQADCVTVDAQQQGRVFYCDGVDNLASVVGFTITGGFVDSMGVDTNDGGGMLCYNSSPMLTECTFLENRATGTTYGCGGGLYCTEYSSPTLTDCTFSGNEADWQGGGLCCQDHSDPMLTNCTFSENRVTYSLGDGGGMYCSYYTSPTLTGCTFSGNETADSSYSSGGGLHCTYASPTLTDCTFSGNRVGGRGGGMYCWNGSVVITSCTFSGNQATGTIGRGGGLYCHGSSATLDHCVFSGNEVTSSGGGLYCNATSPTLTDCTFSGNRATGLTGRGGGVYCSLESFPTLTGCTFSGNEATHQGGMLYCWDSTPVFTNCIIAFNQAGEFVVQCYDEEGTPEGSTPLLVCCNLYGNANGDWVGCIADQGGVDGNFSEEPLFCGMNNDDFTLCANSPCLPDGNDCDVLVGAHGEGCSDCLSPVEMSSWGAIKAMYR